MFCKISGPFIGVSRKIIGWVGFPDSRDDPEKGMGDNQGGLVFFSGNFGEDPLQRVPWRRFMPVIVMESNAVSAIYVLT